MRKPARWTAIVALTGLVGACSAFTPVPSSPPGPSVQPTSNAGPAGSPKPQEQRFEPPYPSSRPAGQLVRIFGPGLLSLDRRELTVQFVGGVGYSAAEPCSDDYTGWTGLEDGVLEVAIVIVQHPDHATLPPGGACTLEGYRYLFHFDLGAPFEGSSIRDLGSGELWIPPPERVAAPQLLPVGWEPVDFGGSNFVDPAPHEIYRMFMPPLALVAAPRPFLTLIQTFGAASDRAEGTAVAKVRIHGAQVDLLRGPEPGEMTAIWMQDGDGLALQALDPDLTVDQFVAIANAVDVPAPAPSASPTPGG